LSTAFQEAENRLLDAQTRITEILKTPEYVAVKRSIILLGSLVLGVAISILRRGSHYSMPPGFPFWYR
jgi:hypothetical protein